MNIHELKKLTDQELKAKLKELKGQLFVMNFQITTGKFNKYADVKKTKIEIAQILTILRAKNQSFQTSSEK